MYFSAASIAGAIERLGGVHPFLGITFLACKEQKLPIGQEIPCSVDTLTKNFMNRVHKICPQSSYFYQPYRSNDRTKAWVVKRYPASGLQAVNTGSFRDVWLHDERERTWGWSRDYVDEIKSKLTQNEPANIIDLAIWIFKDKDWPKGTTLQAVLDFFINHFHISDDERTKLFSDGFDHISFGVLFQDTCVSWNNLSPYLAPPPDATPSRGATLSYLELSDIGPASNLCMELNSRLNIISGDNGLGKTFLMDCAWWALTGTWTDKPAHPRDLSKQSKAAITYELACGKERPTKKSISYGVRQGIWPRDKKTPLIPGLIVYARVDGSYAVWDPVAQHDPNDSQKKHVFSRDDVWDGGKAGIEGLIRDWVKWQSTPEKYPFGILSQVMERMSPPDLGILEPGQPIRMLNEPREIPTIIHPYGEIPIVHVSAGVKRIITLAYLIVWAWHEHTVNAKLRGTESENRLVIFVDEIEAHLHPKWQRVILPALLDIQKFLSDELEVQFIISTHSPLVLASAATDFNDRTDKLFHLRMNLKTHEAELSAMEFINYGPVNSWLTSPIFNLKQARSQEAEEAIEKAKKLQLIDKPRADDVESLHSDLRKCLAESDPFWPRWIAFAERNGVEI